jgi:hypothetical protein
LTLALQLIGDVGAALKKNLDAVAKQHDEAIRRTTFAVAAGIRRATFADIQSSGNFSNRWRSAVKCDVTVSKGAGMVMVRYSSSPLGAMAAAFQQGATILPKSAQYQWIPIGDSRLAPKNAGDLVFVQTPQGALLFSKATHKPLYVGVPRVVLHQRFHLEDAIAKVVAQIPAIYAEIFAQVSR